MIEVNKPKLEEACKLLNRVSASIRATYGEALQILATGRMPEKDRDTERVPLDDLRTVVEIYFPELKNQLEGVVATKDRLGSVYTDVVIAKGIDTAAPCPSQSAVIAAYTNADRACDEFLAKAYSFLRTSGA
jgi:hypothetical protein